MSSAKYVKDTSHRNVLSVVQSYVRLAVLYDNSVVKNKRWDISNNNKSPLAPEDLAHLSPSAPRPHTQQHTQCTTHISNENLRKEQQPAEPLLLHRPPPFLNSQKLPLHVTFYETNDASTLSIVLWSNDVWNLSLSIPSLRNPWQSLRLLHSPFPWRKRTCCYLWWMFFIVKFTKAL